MRTSPTRRPVVPALRALLASVALLGCAMEQSNLPSEPAFGLAADVIGLDAFAWSEPVWLGPVVNSPARDIRPVLSTEGRRLYFHSDRDGGLGGMDIWLTRRAGINCPWETPINLGPPLNTTHGDADVAFTPDMRVVFFASNRPGGEGGDDIFISRRADPADDFAWEQPVNLGQHVNTAANDAVPWYVPSEAGGTLYFQRSLGGMGEDNEIYKVRIWRDGRTRGPAVLVPEVNAPPPLAANAVTVRADGRELIFGSGGTAGVRPGSVGLADLWVSTRRSVNHAWSAPRNLGRPVNTEFPEVAATLSHDGRTLFFNAGQRRGGLGLQDMWMSTRGPSGDDDDDDRGRCVDDEHDDDGR
jgi:hypothetical protein